MSEFWSLTSLLLRLRTVLDTATENFEKTYSSLERSYTFGKIPSNNTTCYRETLFEGKRQASLLIYFKKLPQQKSAISHQFFMAKVAL